MAYLQQDEENEQPTMSTLAPQPQGVQPTSSEAQNQPQNVSGGQTAGIGSDQSQKPQKAASSGMATNYQKIVKANQPQAQNMAQAVVGRFGQQAQSVGQAIQQKQQAYQNQVSQNQQNIQQAQQFGQESVNKAAGAVDQDYVTQQQEQLQARLAALRGMAPQDTNAESLRQQATQQQQAYDNYQNQINALQKQQQNYYDTSGYQQALDAYNQAYKAQQDYKGEAHTHLSQFRDLEQRTKKELADATAAAQQNLNPLQSQYNQYGTQISSLENQLRGAEFQPQILEQQALTLERIADLEGQLADIQSKADAGTLTDEDYTRYQNLLNQKERYDQVALNVAEEARKQSDIATQAQGIESGEVRRQLLRDLIGGQNYTRGESVLDEAILQGSAPAREALVSGVRGVSGDLESQLKAAQQAGLVGQDTLARENRNLVEGLRTGLTGAQDSLVSNIEERLASGDTSALGELRQALEGGIITAEQAQRLGMSGNASLYGVDLQSQLQNLGQLATRESVSNANDLARAQALARLSGQDQSIFLNPETVGQMSQAEQQRMLELSGQVRTARNKAENQYANQLAAYNKAIGGGDSESSIKGYRTQNTNEWLKSVQNLANQRGGIENLSPQDLETILMSPTQVGSNALRRTVDWGAGYLDDATSAQQAMLNAAQGRSDLIGVEGQNYGNALNAYQNARDTQQARLEALKFLTEGSSRGWHSGSGRKGDTLATSLLQEALARLRSGK